MKKSICSKMMLLALGLTLVASPVVAEDAAKVDKPEYYSTLQTEYKLTDEQIKSMTDKGLKGNDQVRVARLASKSGKTLDEVMKMRLEQKMGWGKIAKELGVDSKEIGQAVSDANKAKHEEKKAEKAAKKAAHDAEKAEKKAAKDAEKAEKKASKDAEKAEKKMAQEAKKSEKAESKK